MVNTQMERPIEDKHHTIEGTMLAQTVPRRAIPANPIAAGPINPIMANFMQTQFPAPTAADRTALTGFMRDADPNASYDQVLRDFTRQNPENSISRYYNLIGQDNVDWIINARGQVAFNQSALRSTVESKLGISGMNDLMRNPPRSGAAEITIPVTSANRELAELFVQNAHFPSGYEISGPETRDFRSVMVFRYNSGRSTVDIQ
ncbi:hypothetical protein HY990_07065 [Candidatus Micrarchaeota archaeon]|nr:hypothetical protein [Candidatus Micrarchaeota archaeon]